MHHSKDGITQNKTTYYILKYMWLEGLRRYNFLTDYGFAERREIGVRLKW